MTNITNKQWEVLINIIGAVQTGGQIYGQRRYDDYTNAYTNSSAENSITIGAYQEFNSLAKGLLQEILNKYPSVFRKYDNAGLEADLKKATWDGYNPAKTSAKAKAIVNIISSPEGKKVQDERILAQMKKYAEYGYSLGVTDVDALFEICNFSHQGGTSAAKRIVGKTQKPYTLDNLYKACQSDTGNQVGAYKTRQQKVYQWLKQYMPKSNQIPIEAKGEDNVTNTVITKAKAWDCIYQWLVSELGYLEKASNYNLDSKTGNAGSANYTKYWRDVKPEWNGSYWCACFVCWIFMKAFGKETATKIFKHWPYVYCPTLGSLHKLYANPEVGDIVLFYKNGEFGHTGVVVLVNGDYFETIEGNASGGSSVTPNGGGVVRKSYYNSNLPGTKFVRPDYSLVTSLSYPNGQNISGDSEPVKPSDDYTTYPMIRFGTTGEYVKILQEELQKLGYSLTIDGDWGNQTQTCVKNFQSSNQLEVDGIVGPATWSKLFELTKNKKEFPKTMTVIKTPGVVRKSAKKASKALTKLNAGTKVQATGKKTNEENQLWYKIKTSDGQVGYIIGNNLKG